MELLNQQKIKKLSKKKIRKYLKKILTFLSLEGKEVSFVFSDNFFISKLNKKYFSRNLPTDVIAFPLSDELDANYLGEVVVSVEEAVLVARKLKEGWQRELLLYLIHGILHLVGFTDATAGERKIMEKKQKKILNKFKEITLS